MRSIVLKGDVFIVPSNTLHKLSNRRTLNQFMSDLELDSYYKLKDDDKTLPIWVTCSESSNWFKHLPVSVKQGFKFPPYLPARVFKSCSEGDSLLIRSTITRGIFTKEPVDLHMHLTLKQLEYQYGRWGKFEDALCTLINEPADKNKFQMVNPFGYRKTDPIIRSGAHV